MKPYWIRMSPNPMTCVLKGGETRKETHTGKCTMFWWKEKLDFSCHKGLSRIVSNYQKLEEIRKDSPPEPSKKAWPSFKPPSVWYFVTASTGNKHTVIEDSTSISTPL